MPHSVIPEFAAEAQPRGERQSGCASAAPICAHLQTQKSPKEFSTQSEASEAVYAALGDTLVAVMR
jgi:hypothetical protein